MLEHGLKGRHDQALMAAPRADSTLLGVSLPVFWASS